MRISARNILSGLLAVSAALSCPAATAADGPAGEWKTGNVRSATLMEYQPDLSKYLPDPLRYSLVFVQVRVSDKGEVLDAKLAEGGYHDKDTVRSALQIARKVRIKPATLNGKPVEWNGILPVRYYGVDMSGSTRAVSSEFRTEADKVQSFLERKDFSGAQFHAQWMLSEKVHNDYEYAILQTTLADSFARSSNIHRALAVIRDVTRRSTLKAQSYFPGGPLPTVTLQDFALRRTPFELEHLLKLRFILADSQGLYLDALRAHAEMQALGFIKNEDPSMTRFRDLLQKVKDAPTVTGHIRMDDRSSWPHSLLRNRFRVENARGGKIEEVALNCPGYTRTVAYSPGDEIQIPAEWHGCDALFKGSPGTEFDIVETLDTTDVVPALSVN